MKNTDRSASIQRLEEATIEVLAVVEQAAANPPPTIWRRRLDLMRAARQYGRAIDALARGPRG
jgi:hypothetical protein